MQREPSCFFISKKKAQGERRQGDAGQSQKASEQVASGVNAIEKTQPGKKHNRKNSLSEMFEHGFTGLFLEEVPCRSRSVSTSLPGMITQIA